MLFLGALSCPPSGNSYEEGDSVSLVCSVAISGHESMNPTLEWYRDGTAVDGMPGYIDP